ncbi:hypothetical protein OV203_45575 [Nannocystis sp. ILAH1]|nr:hypothetical protein [Nannocystis sp. ILAH1]MCY0994480.1 hypothetical protein [Nannocystis sp. ILAH1]
MPSLATPVVGSSWLVDATLVLVAAAVVPVVVPELVASVAVSPNP